MMYSLFVILGSTLVGFIFGHEIGVKRGVKAGVQFGSNPANRKTVKYAVKFWRRHDNS